MKLTARLVMFLVLTLAILVAGDGYLEYTHERELIRDAMSRDAGVLGHTMSAVLGKAWKSIGQERALALIAHTDEGEVDAAIRWVWLDARSGGAFMPKASPHAVILASLRTGDLVGGGASDELYSYFPVENGATRRGALELSQSTRVLSQRAARILRRAMVQLIAAFVIAALTVYFIGVRLIGRPLGRLMEKIGRVGDGDLSSPLVLDGGHELQTLADGLNSMCERLAESHAKIAEETAAKIAAIEQSRHADRLSTVGTLASGVAHELGTPLNVVGGRATLIAEDKLDGQQVKESAQIIVTQADRMSEIIRQLLVFARRGSSGTERIDIHQAARQSLALLQSVAKKKSVTLELSENSSKEAFAECSSSALQQVLANLIVNAVQANSEGDTVTVQIGRVFARPDGEAQAAELACVRVDVQDAGGGIPDDQLSHVFEPFFTTKDVGGGTGLGLSIVHGILRDHGGWITATSIVGQGSCFTFYLPASDT